MVFPCQNQGGFITETLDCSMRRYNNGSEKTLGIILLIVVSLVSLFLLRLFK